MWVFRRNDENKKKEKRNITLLLFPPIKREQAPLLFGSEG